MNIEFLPLFFSFFFFSINERERKRKNFHSRDETSVSTFVDRFRWEVSMTRLSFSSPGFTGWQDGKGRKKVIYFIWETRTFTFTSFFFSNHFPTNTDTFLFEILYWNFTWKHWQFSRWLNSLSLFKQKSKLCYWFH